VTLPPGIPELRQFVESMYLHEPTEVQRLEQYTDEDGYQRTRWETSEITKSFAVPVGQRELLRAQQMGIEVEARRLLPIGVELTTDDVLYVDEQRWNITGIPEMTEEFAANVEVYLRRR
jgi:hypothetical protein